MTIDICINFENNPGGIFYAGQLLRGTAQLTLSEEKTVRGVYICIKGKAFCQWTEGGGKYSQTYTGEELFLNETTYLVGKSEGNVKLMPGTQSYNFQCNLPNGLPTSVEGHGIGYIRYTANVTVDIPMGFDKKLKQRFTVIRPLNLNNHPALRHPVTSARSEIDCCSSILCCFCICMNPIEVSAQIPVGGYTPGQFINLQLHVNHKGNPKAYIFNVKLMKRIDYYSANSNDISCWGSESGHNNVTQCITEKVSCCRISNTNSVEIVRVDLQVPPVPPTDCNSSRVVKVSYYLNITTLTGDCNGRPTNTIPITIGTYPIEDFDAPNSIASAPVLNQPTAPLLDSAFGQSLDKESPTYEATDETDADGDDFKPKYPMFKRRTSYSIGN